MRQYCDGSRRRRHDPAKSWWYATWRSIRFGRRFGWPPVQLLYGNIPLILDR